MTACLPSKVGQAVLFVPVSTALESFKVDNLLPALLSRRFKPRVIASSFAEFSPLFPL